MIESSLNYIKKRLNGYLKLSFNAEEDLVELSSLNTNDESAAILNRDKLVIQLIRVEKTTMPYQARTGSTVPEQLGINSQPIYLNLYLLVAANYTSGNYAQGLAYLSEAIRFFQDHASLERHNAPDLPNKISKLAFEIENVGAHDLSNIWSMVGSSYQPSVVYQMRLLSIGGTIKGQVANISRPAHPQAEQY